MSLFLKHLSAWLFYTLGISFFVAYMLHLNEIWVPWPAFWLNVADLPLLAAGMLYGGTSLYRSVKKPDGPSPLLAAGIALPLVLLFILLATMNFWELTV